MSLPKDITGKRFGKLKVLRRAGTSERGEAMWRCRCDCGNEKTAKGWLLNNGQVQSCGCLKLGDPDRASKLEAKRKAQAGRERQKRTWQGRGAHAYELKADGVPLSSLEWARKAWA